VLDDKTSCAYIIGVALGDGNLSCPNGRATRLRVSCDKRYLNLIEEIKHSLSSVFPKNKVSLVLSRKDNCIDISVYSNQLNGLIPWKVNCGSKIEQQAHIPEWIMQDSNYSKACLKGLFQTDGSIYNDRGYTMVNFTNLIKPLINDVYTIISELHHTPHLYSSVQQNGNIKYVIRISKNTSEFISDIGLTKS
jgi:DNA-binding transcriptional regulator WhiA